MLQKRQQRRSPKNVQLDLAIKRPIAAIGAGLDDNGYMTIPRFDAATAALQRLLLSSITPAMAAETEGMASISERINACMERVKVDASEGAALVAECVPHGRVMVAQAQKTLANLEALAVMQAFFHEHKDDFDFR